MRASVIVVNYNGGTLLRECLRSLAASLGPDDEAIVVDNASSDGSVDDLPPMEQLCLWRSAQNLGYAGGNNRGVDLARGRYLVFLNPDTVVEPDWLNTLIATLEADSSIGLATPAILLLRDRQRINTVGNDTHYTGLTLCRGMGRPARDLGQPGEVTAVSGAAFAIHAALFRRLGGFDETFFLYMEDTDLSWRARLAGYRCVAVPGATVYHDYELRFGPRKLFYQERNRYLMLLKGLDPRTLLALLPALLLAEIITWGFALMQPAQLANKLRAYAWVATHWPYILRRHHETQRLRRVSDRDLIDGCPARIDYRQAGDTWAARVSAALFDPLFSLWQRVALAVIHW